MHRHGDSDGSIAVFDIRSLLQHLNGATCCSVTDAWAQIDAPVSPTVSASVSAVGGAGAAAAPASASLSGAMTTCGPRCAARLAIQKTTASLLAFAVLPLAPAGALTRSGALAPFAQALLHTPQPPSCSLDGAAAAAAAASGPEASSDAASLGISALVFALLTLLRLLTCSTDAAAASAPSIRSCLRVCRALVASIHDLRNRDAVPAGPAVAGKLDRLRDEPCWIRGDMTMKALSGLLSTRARLLPQSHRLRIVESILKRTYAGGHPSLLPVPVSVRRTATAPAGLTTTATAHADDAAWECGVCQSAQSPISSPRRRRQGF